MQVKDYKNTIERSLFYTSSLYIKGVNKKTNYNKIPRSIGIWILKFDEFEDGPFHEIARLKRDYENTLLTNKMEIHFIQLPKFRRKCKTISNELEQWLKFLSFKNPEELKMLNNKYVKKAEEELEYLSGDEAERRIAELRENGERDYYSAMMTAREEGIQEGEKIGEKKGEKNNSIQIAKKC